MTTSDARYKVCIYEFGSGKEPTDTIPVSGSFRNAEQVERGTNVNLNHGRFYTKIELVDPPKMVAFGSLSTNRVGEERWFEFNVTMSDGLVYCVVLDVGKLKEMGTGVESLKHTRKLKDWLASEAGRKYIEGVVHAQL